MALYLALDEAYNWLIKTNRRWGGMDWVRILAYINLKSAVGQGEVCFRDQICSLSALMRTIRGLVRYALKWSDFSKTNWIPLCFNRI